ncbi:MAG TPA: ester cyclase [Vicinamibacterales bacterium]|nr:ester cyclase [Vicinamibacterales bacterium]
MTRDEIVSFFEARQLDWRARNPESLAGTHAADGTVVSPMFGALHGRSEIADSYRRLFATFPDWYFKSEELIIDGARVAQHFVATATHVGEFMGLPGTNRHGRLEGVLLYTMKDGLILHEQRQYDYSALLIQIGVLRSKPNF